jgi:hypothetical protein
MMIDDNNTYRNGINHPQVLVRPKPRANFKSKQIGKQTRPLKKKKKKQKAWTSAHCAFPLLLGPELTEGATYSDNTEEGL